jgi:hypothetical protein
VSRAGHVADALAAAFLAGVWNERQLVHRAGRALEPRPPWLRAVAKGVLDAHPHPPRDRPRELARLVATFLPDELALPRVVRHATPATQAVRTPFAGVPRLDTVGDLAALLGHDVERLLWLADTRSLERAAHDERLRHYRYLWRERADGRLRLLEAPKPALRAAQRRLLDELIVHVPPHPAAHALTGLATNVVPSPMTRGAPFRTRRRLATPHLPQGAPTSPALANLAALALDRRLAGVAAAFGATYTRYADDLAFSGGTGVLRRTHALRAAVATVVAEEGFTLHERKTRLCTTAGSQRVCGLVVNAHPNVARAEFDRLKAVLHAAALDGPGDLDRARVEGQVAWVAHVNPARGAKLRARLDRIDWAAQRAQRDHRVRTA